MFRAEIENAVKNALAAIGAQDANFIVERPTNMAHGDYATNAALVAKVDAHELVAKLHVEGIEKIEVVGKFINFWLSRTALIKEIQPATQDGWSANDLHKNKKILVEYTDPNPFKEFHIGHLMSNAIGESIARLFENSGAQVVRANYQGDIGPHVAKAIWGKIQKPEALWGEAYVYGDQNYEGSRGEIDAINKKLYEKSDPEVNKLYDAGRKESLAHFEEIYKKLDTKFDFYFFESETAPKGLEIIKKHPKLFEKSEGATVFHGKHTRVFITSQGLPTYEAKELGLAELKQEKAPADVYITVTASEQSGFFEVVFEAIEKIFPALRGKLIHRAHGHMRFTEGKMSSRKGNVITGESLFLDLQKAARGREDVAVGAIKYAVLKQGSGKDIIFDPEKSLSLEGDSGPYLQYALVRARSLIRAAKEAQIGGAASDVPEHAGALERMLVHFPEVLTRAARELEPHYVTTYLTELASAFNSWYASERIIGGAHPASGGSNPCKRSSRPRHSRAGGDVVDFLNVDYIILRG